MWWIIFASAFAGSSDLWGEAGERWDPAGRLPDFSFAGYRAGEHPLPEPPVVASVHDFGAVGDGETDDTEAIQAAIDATSGGALWLPAGTYRITSPLYVRHGDVVLRGEGSDATVLSVERPLAEAIEPRPQWSWEGGFVWVAPPSGAAPALASVAADAARGDVALTLDDASGVVAGDVVLLRLTDDEAGTLGRHLHNDQASGGDCTWQATYRLDWPVRVASVAGDVVELAQPLRTDVRAAWAPRLLAPDPVVGVGVEGLTFRFPDVAYAGHLNEPGYNGVYFTRGVVDAWVRDVVFENADNGVLTGDWVKGLQVEDVAFRGRRGHHGVNLAFLADGLLQDLHFAQGFVHELTVDHRTNGTVFKRVSAEGDQIVALDHHRDASFENLFTHFSAPTSWVHGGSWCAGPPSGARGTFWNLAGPVTGPYWGYVQTNVIGELAVDEARTDDREWFEAVDDLWPPDLHDAQLRSRLGLAPPDRPEDPSDPSDPITPKPEGCACGGAGDGAGWLGALLALALVRRRV